MKSSNEIREDFLSFFEAYDHRRVKSSSLVPHDDATLLFTNAGMNQFKNVFLGRENLAYKRATSSQKCMRVSGKHNDLEEVGQTPRHHTFFEMLGNFSFSDYFKEKAIDFAWELCTQVYGLAKERLAVSVFEEDQEAYQLWKNRIGVPESRIYLLGTDENFWSMGDTGPCGPCSELHYDMGFQGLRRDNSKAPDPNYFLEIWNLVFMQFSKGKDGHQTLLPTPSIDTGMGLERISSVLQNVQSTYDTDLFLPIIKRASKIIGVAYGKNGKNDISLRILADHSRACAFLINDGVVPGNEGQGYVLRKILRRAIRNGKMMGHKEPFLFTLVALVSDLMKGSYPELESSRDYASRLVKTEEEKFASTLNHGLQLLEDLFETAIKKGDKKLPGDELFRLYDTYGFPLDMAREIAKERKFSIDEKVFYQEMEKQRKRARASWTKTDTDLSRSYQELFKTLNPTDFLGYKKLKEVSGTIVSLVKDTGKKNQLEEGESGELLLNCTPFYAESGGQVGDRGKIESGSNLLKVYDTYQPLPGFHLHRVKVLQGSFSIGDEVSSSVDSERRNNTARNHTATHLLHSALREVLGGHVKQAGSLVTPERLRFDFSHFQSLSKTERGLIEEIVNKKICENIKLSVSISDLEKAIETGAMALFGEKYGDKVRTVSIPGFSLELCGGTHVESTGDIALFKLLHESSISAGVRRIEAITGLAALQRFQEAENLLDRISSALKVGRDDCETTIVRLSNQLKKAEKHLVKLQLDLALEQTSNILSEVRNILGIKVLSKRIKGLDKTGLRSLANQLKDKLKSGVVVLGTASDEKVSLIAMVSTDLTAKVQANKLVSKIAQVVKGGGGGRPDIAEAGGSDPALLDLAIESVYAEVESTLR